LEQLVHPGRLSLVRMVELFTRGPLGILGRERKIAAGQPADLTIFSLDRAWTYQVERSPSKSRNSPFDGKKFKGGPVATIVAGRGARSQTTRARSRCPRQGARAATRARRAN